MGYNKVNYDIMSVSEQEKASLFQCERRMAIMIAAKAASSTEGANHDIMKQNHLRASVILRNALSEFCSRYIKVHGQFSCSWTFYLHYFYYHVTYSDSK